MYLNPVLLFLAPAAAAGENRVADALPLPVLDRHGVGHVLKVEVVLPLYPLLVLVQLLLRGEKLRC